MQGSSVEKLLTIARDLKISATCVAAWSDGPSYVRDSQIVQSGMKVNEVPSDGFIFVSAENTDRRFSCKAVLVDGLMI